MAREKAEPAGPFPRFSAKGFRARGMVRERETLVYRHGRSEILPGRGGGRKVEMVERETEEEGLGNAAWDWERRVEMVWGNGAEAEKEEGQSVDEKSRILSRDWDRK